MRSKKHQLGIHISHLTGQTWGEKIIKAPYFVWEVQDSCEVHARDASFSCEIQRAYSLMYYCT